jgi:hypothetical protein
MSTSAQSHKYAKKRRGDIKRAKAAAEAEDLRDKEANPEGKEKSSLLGKRQPEPGIDTPPSHRRRGEEEPAFSPTSSAQESEGESDNEEREKEALNRECISVIQGQISFCRRLAATTSPSDAGEIMEEFAFGFPACPPVFGSLGLPLSLFHSFLGIVGGTLPEGVA